MKRFIYLTLIVVVAVVLSACTKETPQSNSAAADVPTPTPQVLKNTPVQPELNDTVETFSSDQLGFCFAYPQGYTQIPSIDKVEIVAPENQGTDLRGLFWIEISDAYDRTAEVIADQDMTYAAGLDVGRWQVTLGGEQAVVLDGMPGQDLVRRVYVVHEGTLYILVFTPTRSQNTAAAGQMEALYIAVTSSWSWAPCSAGD